MRPLLLALSALALAGCAHTHYNPDAGKVCYRRVCYEVGALGKDWQPVESEKGAIGFFNQQLGAVIESKATCRADADAAPLQALTRQLLIGYTDRHVRSSETLSLDGRAALHTVVDARLDGVPMVLDLYVLKRNGCIFDLTLAAPPDRYDAARPELTRFVGGFHDTRKT